jgi:hypothetical protein
MIRDFWTRLALVVALGATACQAAPPTTTVAGHDQTVAAAGHDRRNSTHEWLALAGLALTVLLGASRMTDSARSGASVQLAGRASRETRQVVPAPRHRPETAMSPCCIHQCHRHGYVPKQASHAFQDFVR